jgi:hypothetical protein
MFRVFRFASILASTGTRIPLPCVFCCRYASLDRKHNYRACVCTLYTLYDCCILSGLAGGRRYTVLHACEHVNRENNVYFEAL